MASKPVPKPIPKPEDFSPEEMEQIQHFGQALQHGGTTDFDEEVERHLQEHERTHEAGYKKMRAAQTGGAPGQLGATGMQQAAAKQQTALGQQAGTAGQIQATQAQAAQASSVPPPPAAPTGPAGVSQPYPAEREETPPGVPEKQ